MKDCKDELICNFCVGNKCENCNKQIIKQEKEVITYKYTNYSKKE